MRNRKVEGSNLLLVQREYNRLVFQGTLNDLQQERERLMWLKQNGRDKNHSLYLMQRREEKKKEKREESEKIEYLVCIIMHINSHPS